MARDVHEYDAVMGVALDEAAAALEHDDVPVGAVVVRRADGEVLARRHNEREHAGDPTAHAELLAIADAAAARDGWRLDDCALVVTLEPCPMCAGAALLARIPLVVFGAPDPNAGALASLYLLGAAPRLHHLIDVGDGVRAEVSAPSLTVAFV